MAILCARGFTKSLAILLHETLRAFPLRIWLLDNSASMTIADGQRPVKAKKLKMIKCTRWQELKHTVMDIAELSADLKARSFTLPERFHQFLLHQQLSGIAPT